MAVRSLGVNYLSTIIVKINEYHNFNLFSKFTNYCFRYPTPEVKILADHKIWPKITKNNFSYFDIDSIR